MKLLISDKDNKAKSRETNTKTYLDGQLASIKQVFPLPPAAAGNTTVGQDVAANVVLNGFKQDLIEKFITSFTDKHLAEIDEIDDNSEDEYAEDREDGEVDVECNFEKRQKTTCTIQVGRDYPRNDFYTETLNDDQYEEFNLLWRSYSATDYNAALLLYVQGGPGVGKTYVVRQFIKAMIDRPKNMDRLVDYQDGEIILTATTGVAASILGLGCTTVHSTFFRGLGGGKRGQDGLMVPPKTDDSRKVKFSNSRMLVIDEVSLLGAKHFGDIETICRHLICHENGHEKRTFGSLRIVLVQGDFFQLPAVKQTLITKALSQLGNGYYNEHLNPKSLAEKHGAQVWMQFKRLRLTKWVRATDQILQTLLNKVQKYEDLKPGTDTPLDAEAVQLLLKQVMKTDDDITGPKINDAVIAVTTNSERSSLNNYLIQVYGQVNKQPVLEWENEIMNTHWNKLPCDTKQTLRDLLPDLQTRVALGAKMCITDNSVGIARLGTANGVPVTCQGVVFVDNDVADRVRILIAAAKGGDIVKIPRPDYVVVKHYKPDEEIIGKFPKYLQPATSALTREQGDNVVLKPGNFLIEVSSSKGKTYSTILEHGNLKLELFFKKVHLDPGFAVTIHKLQGSTWKEVYLDLNGRPHFSKLKALDLESLRSNSSTRNTTSTHRCSRFALAFANSKDISSTTSRTSSNSSSSRSTSNSTSISINSSSSSSSSSRTASTDMCSTAV